VHWQESLFFTYLLVLYKRKGKTTWNERERVKKNKKRNDVQEKHPGKSFETITEPIKRWKGEPQKTSDCGEGPCVCKGFPLPQQSR
jgi:hypothetical protein